MMTDEEFWELIDMCRAQAGQEVEKQAKLLTEKLANCDFTDLVKFRETFSRYLQQAYDERLWAAGTILDELSDDGFYDFRAWLISRGKQAYFHCLHDPEALSLYASPGERVTAEEFHYLAANAFKRKTGRSDFELLLAPVQHIDKKNASLQWKTAEGYPDEERLRSLFPQLWQNFHPNDSD